MKKRDVDLMESQWDHERMLTDEAEIEKTILYEKDAERAIARIIFNDPDHLNAIPIAACERVGDLIKEAEADNDVKVIIFKGVGSCFGVGGDARELGHYIGYKTGTSKEERRRPSQRQRMLPDRNLAFGAFELTRTECLKATICQVHGYCYGGHMMLALGADIVIASAVARFGHPAFRYLGPAPQDLYLWIENLGFKKMREIMLTMRPMTAEEGYQAGFVTKVVPREDLEQWTEDYADAITPMPLDGLMMGKAMFQFIMEARGKGVGSVTGWVGHAWSTNLVFGEDEFNFVKERRDKGLTKALKDRDEMVAPFFRMVPPKGEASLEDEG